VRKVRKGRKVFSYSLLAFLAFLTFLFPRQFPFLDSGKLFLHKIMWNPSQSGGGQLD
jgi:hypothetical protein